MVETGTQDLFPELRRGYSGRKEETKEADARCAGFVGGKTLKGGWWAGNLTEGLLTRRYTLIKKVGRSLDRWVHTEVEVAPLLPCRA